MLCGTDSRHVGHSAFRVHPCSWQVHGISITKKMLFQGVCALGAAGFRVDRRCVSHNLNPPSVCVACSFESMISYAWMANKKGAGGIIRGIYVDTRPFAF